MKKFILVLFLILLPAVSFAQPSIVFEAESYDSGTVNQGDILEHIFNFTNAGDKELVIEKVSPS